jgi:lipid-A-disaccharide synthase-like uncharacterized protein
MKPTWNRKREMKPTWNRKCINAFHINILHLWRLIAFIMNVFTQLHWKQTFFQKKKVGFILFVIPIIFWYFLIILQNYTTVSKFIRFNDQTPWRTAVEGPTTVAHGGLTKGRGLNGREGQPPWPKTVVGPGGGVPPARGGWDPAAVGHSGRVVRPLWATATGRGPQRQVACPL